MKKGGRVSELEDRREELKLQVMLLWDNIKQANILISGVTEEEESGRKLI